MKFTKKDYDIVTETIKQSCQCGNGITFFGGCMLRNAERLLKGEKIVLNGTEESFGLKDFDNVEIKWS